MNDPSAQARPDQSQLACLRTFLAYERTLMAWVRTAVSLITFGFTLYKSTDIFLEMQSNRRVEQVLSPRDYALIMIGIGVVSLTSATWQHRKSLGQLRQDFPTMPFSQATLLATLIAALGLLSLTATILRL